MNSTSQILIFGFCFLRNLIICEIMKAFPLSSYKKFSLDYICKEIIAKFQKSRLYPFHIL